MNGPTFSGGNALFPAWLLRSKVSPTRQRVDLLDRRSHTLQLHQALDATLTVVHAPAGYGKSTILSNWRDLLVQEGHLVCWLSLGKEDDDATQLLSYLALALAVGGMDFESKGIALEHHYNELSIRHFLSILIHAIAEHDSRVVLMLDDFEHLGRKVIEEVIEPLLKWAPDNLHLAIATRDDSRLAISNLESKGKAVRYGGNQLRFTPQELREFFGEQLDAGMIQRLFDITEGWPVAIQMIRSALAEGGDVRRILDSMAGDRTSIASYLSEEVLSNLDEALQSFLMRVSLVDRVSCDFADYLCEQSGSHAKFNAARSLDTLVLPVDNVEMTYRLHPLFREHLYERLKNTRPDEVRTLHLRAAQWFSDRGNVVEAVLHCVMAKQTQRAVPFIVQAGGVMSWFKDGLASLRAILRLLDRETILGDRRMALLQCLLDVKDGKMIQARQLFEDISCEGDRHEGGARPDPDRPDPGDVVAMGTVLALCEGKPISEPMFRQLEGMANTGGLRDPAAMGNWSTFLCVANLQRGTFNEARKFASLANRAFTSAGTWYSASYIHFHLGAISYAEGNSGDAAKCYKQGLHLCRTYFNDDQGMKLVANILISQLDYELNTLNGSSGQVRMIPRQLERNEAWFNVHIVGYTVAAHQEFNQQGVEAAMNVVEQGLDYAGANKLPRLSRLLTCLKIDLQLRAGLQEAARAELDRSAIRVDDYRSASGSQYLWLERDAAILAVAGLLIRENRHDEALPILEEFCARANSDGQFSARLTYQLLLALAHQGNGNVPAGRLHLESALAMHAASGFIRSFLDRAPALIPMLEGCADGGADGGNVHAETAKAILLQCRDAGHLRRIETLLSDREAEVMQQLSFGYSNKIIARNICVSDNTVRFHLRNIFAKLNVENRLQAVAAARKLKII